VDVCRRRCVALLPLCVARTADDAADGAVVAEMIAYAHDTAHEKTASVQRAPSCACVAHASAGAQVRGIAVALAFMCYEQVRCNCYGAACLAFLTRACFSQEERADALIEQMSSDKVEHAHGGRGFVGV
jgi:hypothetical protein